MKKSSKKLYIKAYVIDEEGRVMAQKKRNTLPVEHASIAEVDTLVFSSIDAKENQDLMVAAAVNIASVLLYSGHVNSGTIPKIVQLSEIGADLMRRAKVD